MKSALKKTCRFAKIIMVVAFLVVSATGPSTAHAASFEFMASIFDVASSFLGKVISSFSEILNTPPPSAHDNSSLVSANCVPPVPQKPAGIDTSARHGLLTVTPEVSTAGPNDVVTISVAPNLDPLAHVSIRIPVGTSKDDLIDWYPKKSPGIDFNQNNSDSEKGYGVYGWGLINSRILDKLPTNQTYWVKIRVRHSTITERAKDMTDDYGWRKIQYDISNPGTSSRGFHGLYVGREQKPSLMTTIANYSDKYQTFFGPFLKPFIVIPNGYFEVQTKSLGQPGTITMNVKYGKILGESKRQVKADETTTWKVQPLKIRSTLLQELSLANTCGQDYFMDPAQSAKLSELDQFRFPVEYDFDKLTSDMVDLSMGKRGEYAPLTAGSKESFGAFAGLFTKGETSIPVPNVPITLRVVYQDNHNETMKHMIFKGYDQATGKEKESRGEATITTIKDLGSSAAGLSLVWLSGSTLTDKDAQRGIVLVATAKKFPELSAKMTIPVFIPKKSEAQPEPPAPTPKPTPPPAPKPIAPPSTQVSVKNLLVTAERTLGGLKETDKVAFKALLKMTDGSTMNAEAGRVTWTVVGKIGSISPAGVFEAQLDESIAEYGEGSGAVVATYKDASGKTFVGKSDIFKVEAAVPEGGEEDG